MTGLDMTEDVIDNGSFIITSEHGAVPVFGHEAKWRVSNNSVPYETLVAFCQANQLNVALVPPPRCGNDSFALAVQIFNRRSKTTVTLSEESDWDGNTFQETWSVRALLRGREYALIRERLGKKDGRKHIVQTPIYRLEYVPSAGTITTEEWRTNFQLRSQGVTQLTDEEGVSKPVGPADEASLRSRVRIVPYSPDTGIADVDGHIEMVQRLQDKFVEMSTTVDEVLMRNKLKSLMVSHRAVPDSTVKGGIYQIANEKKAEELKDGEVQPHLTTLRPFGLLLRYWGNQNKPDPTADDAVWADDDGRVDYRLRGDLRLVPRVKTEDLLEEMTNNVEQQLNVAFGEMHENIRELLRDLKAEALDTEKNAKGAEKQQERLRKRADQFRNESQKLHQMVEQFQEQLGRDLNVRTTPYKDQQDELDSRLAAIRTVDEVTADRFMTMLGMTKEEPKAGGFDGLGSLFG